MYLFDFGTDHQITTSEARSKQGGTVMIQITSSSPTSDPTDPMRRHLTSHRSIHHSPLSNHLTILRWLSDNNPSQHKSYHRLLIFSLLFPSNNLPTFSDGHSIIYQQVTFGIWNSSPDPSSRSLICTTDDFISLFIYVSYHFSI